MAGAIRQDRGIVSVEGPDAASFLDRVVTCAAGQAEPGRARFGALLSPQGKVLADFVLLRSGPEAFWLDTPAACAADLARRLGMYRLRARLAVADVSDRLGVTLRGCEDAVAAAPDPRHPGLGERAVVAREGRAVEPPDPADEARRIGLGIPACGVDFGPGEAFPHEALMDQFGGVDFEKGCYIGQEIVSRMQHRGTARTRFVSVAFQGSAPVIGSAVTAGERGIGRLTSVAGEAGLTLIRVDRAGEALAAGAAILAGNAPLAFTKPGWVRFPYPAELAAAAVA